MGKQNPKYETHIHGPVQGVVIGEGNTVTFTFQSGEQQTVPFLAPPRPPHDLIGRDEQLGELKQQLFAGGSLALSALNGIPGVGKTALALALAHDRAVLEHFQDGILWAGLGRDADETAVLSHLGTWATALGFHSDEFAKLTRVEDRAKAIHATIGSRRMLLVVDDAWQSERALAFKLGGPNCAHIVTTRLREVALTFAREDTTVPELNVDDSLQLLKQLAPDVVAAEPEKAQALVEAVGGLPLALILMGNYLRLHSSQPRRLTAALETLQQAKQRLALTQPQALLERHPSLPEGAWSSLQAVIDISDAALDENSRQALQALSVFPPKPNTFSEEAALAVSAAPVETLDALTDAGLLESSGEGRYTLHQTITDFARIKLTDNTVYERISLLLTNLGVLAGRCGDLVQAENDFQDALFWAERLNQKSAICDLLTNLGELEQNRGDNQKAKAYLQKGLLIAEELGHRESISFIQRNLGRVAYDWAEYEQAAEHFREGMKTAREIGHRVLIILLCQEMAQVKIKRSEYTQADAYLKEGLDLARALEHIWLLSNGLNASGNLYIERKKFDKASVAFREAKDLAQKIKTPELDANALYGLAQVEAAQGNITEARCLGQESLTIFEEICHHKAKEVKAWLDGLSEKQPPESEGSESGTIGS